MKRISLLLSTLLILYSLYACMELTPLQAPTNEVNGTWIGSLDVIEQSGNYFTNYAPMSATVTIQGTNQSLMALTYIVSPAQPTGAGDPFQYTGTLNNHQVSLHRTSGASCDPTRRTYIFNLSGTIKGDSLTMMGNDTACPVQRWIFHDTFRLIRQ